jgi:hypothetical protein
MADWYLLGGLAAGAAYLVSRGTLRRRGQQSAADASGLAPVADLTHVSPALQRTALWALADGGFERRVLHGALTRGPEQLDLTVFDLDTLRERRGEWAYLPVEPPFRISGAVSVVVCEVDRAFGHVLFKRFGPGDDLAADALVERAGSISKLARVGLGMPSSYAAELPKALGAAALDVALPPHWRAYGDAALVRLLLGAGFARALDQASRRDLVIELLDGIAVVYPAARDVVGAEALADLTSTALSLVDGVLACSRSHDGASPTVRPG